jgi:hypothetical protein
MRVRLTRTLLLCLTLALVLVGALGAPLLASIARQAANTRPSTLAPDDTWVALIETARMRDEERSGALIVQPAMHLCGLDEIGWDGNVDDCDAESRHILRPNPGSSISPVLRHRLVEFSMTPGPLPLSAKNSSARLLPSRPLLMRGRWSEFGRQHPGARGFLQYSRAVLSGDGQTAVMYEQFACGEYCIAATLYEFTRSDDSWMVNRAEWLWGGDRRMGSARLGSAQIAH